MAGPVYHRCVTVDRGPSGRADRVALLIPGHVYSPERPLLHFAGAVFAKHGWSTREIRWPEPPPERDGQEFSDWFARLRSFALIHIGLALDHEPASRIALVGKAVSYLVALTQRR